MCTDRFIVRGHLQLLHSQAEKKPSLMACCWRNRADSVSGIMNGVDYSVWDPASDPHIAHHYSACDVTAKQVCKAAIQEEMGLEVSADTPLVAFMSRLAHQKMPDIVLEAIPTLISPRHPIRAQLRKEPRSTNPASVNLARNTPGGRSPVSIRTTND